MEHHTPNIPWHLCIHRWEVQNLSLLPTDLQQAVITRRQAREQMTFSFSNFILQLPIEVRKSIMTTKHRRTNVIKEILVEDLRQKHTASSPKQQMESEQEMEEKRKKKEEEKRKKEEEKKQREEEKKQREEEKRQREEEKKQREEEKRQREEEKKRQKEEERRQKEEEKKKREEEKRKKEQSQLRLTSLFSKTSESIQEKTLEPVRPTLFPAFYIKDHVEIVDIHQFSQPGSSIDEFKRQLTAQQHPVSIQQFISDLPAESKQKRGATTPVDIRTLLLPGSADLLNVPNVRLVLRMKLLQFMENVRPAYFGTFTQRSRTVHGRNPFGRDTDVFNYEHDSEAEWEPEGEGEDIHSDEDDDDPNVDMIDPEDAGWLVPEGYLSDSEGVDDEDKDSKDDRMHSIKHASKRVAIRKVVLGPYFEGETEEMEVFKQFETQFFTDLSEGGYDPFSTKHLQNAATSTTDASNTAAHTATTVQHKLEFTEEQSQALINVIHEKSKESIPNLVIEAKSNSFLKDVSKRQLEAKIKDIAIKEKRGADTKPTWYLKDDRKQNQP
ncbi:chromatin assembly factor 1 subunit A-domain-containing protein [Choanephora cucurbitarum]|nr:chromatin assembly factor 1 subunit A-domain-containing protein [Choanephora cucurbitarum]